MSDLTHLDEVALEALANGREDLVDEAALDHLDECEACAERVALEQGMAEDASMALHRAMPELEELDSMIARAMEVAVEADGAPSRRSLWLGGALGAAIAVVFGVLSAPSPSSVSGLTAAGRQLLTLGRAVDGLVEGALPGGWIAVAMLGLFSALLLAVPTRLLLRNGRGRPGPIVTGALSLLALGVVAIPGATAHAYHVEGAWPEPMPTVTVDVDAQPTTEALRQATQSGGLGVVARLPEDPNVTLHVQDAPMDEVFEALLGQMDVVVRPGASLVNVRPQEAPAPQQAAGHPTPPAPTPPTPPVPAVAPTPPTPPTPPLAARSTRGVGDRVTFGDNVEVGADEVVRDVFTMGGDAQVFGRALGDVVTLGGDADITGEVIGNVATMGGNINVSEGATVHGDLNAMGGEIEVADGATVHGQALANPDGLEHHDDREEPAAQVTAPKRPFAGMFRWGLFNALVFLFGLFMLGSSRKRFTNLRAELEDRPVRSAFGGFFGAMAALALTVVLCLTVLGIPGAMVLALLMVVAVGVGWTASAWWLGGALPFKALEERPVLQLAAGVGVLFLFGLVPKVGALLVIGAVLAGFGAVIATEFGNRTRAPKKPKHVPTGPFRTQA